MTQVLYFGLPTQSLELLWTLQIVECPRVILPGYELKHDIFDDQCDGGKGSDIAALRRFVLAYPPKSSKGVGVLEAN